MLLAQQAAPVPPGAGATAQGRELNALQLGDLAMARKLYRDAIDSYRKGPQNDFAVWNRIGIAYQQLQEFRDARKAYERALKLNPGSTVVLNNLGTTYFAEKSYRRAISAYKKAIRAEGTDKVAALYSNLGTAYFARKQYKEATAAYARALEIDPGIFEQRSLTGTVVQDKGIEERAKFHYFLAKLYAKSGRNELAIQYLRKAIEEGFTDRKRLLQDEEFKPLHDVPEFQAVIELHPRIP